MVKSAVSVGHEVSSCPWESESKNSYPNCPESREGKGGLCFSESSEREGGWYYYVIDSLAVFPEGLNDPGSDENVLA